DDLIATGGTLEASIKLIQQLKGNVHECATIINLPDLGGAKRIKDTYGLGVYSICEFEGH
ncbi:MAG: adenine phosphoribosyltransferase, partial [Leptospira sp.]|nr:adenine phosphoribosyltransferase [Leptospira sp.]